jgi:hypothetical protein
MVAIENTGTSSEIKEQYEKNEKFVGRDFFLLPHLQKLKGGGAER